MRATEDIRIGDKVGPLPTLSRETYKVVKPQTNTERHEKRANLRLPWHEPHWHLSRSGKQSNDYPTMNDDGPEKRRRKTCLRWTTRRTHGPILIYVACHANANYADQAGRAHHPAASVFPRGNHASEGGNSAPPCTPSRLHNALMALS